LKFEIYSYLKNLEIVAYLLLFTTIQHFYVKPITWIISSFSLDQCFITYLDNIYMSPPLNPNLRIIKTQYSQIDLNMLQFHPKEKTGSKAKLWLRKVMLNRYECTAISSKTRDKFKSQALTDKIIIEIYTLQQSWKQVFHFLSNRYLLENKDKIRRFIYLHRFAHLILRGYATTSVFSTM